MTVSFKKTDLTRAATAMLDAGLQLERVELGKDGRIVMFPKTASYPNVPPAPVPVTPPQNPPRPFDPMAAA